MKFGELLIKNKIKNINKFEEIKGYIYILDTMINDMSGTTIEDVSKWLDEVYKIMEK